MTHLNYSVLFSNANWKQAKRNVNGKTNAIQIARQGTVTIIAITRQKAINAVNIVKTNGIPIIPAKILNIVLILFSLVIILKTPINATLYIFDEFFVTNSFF